MRYRHETCTKIILSKKAVQLSTKMAYICKDSQFMNHNYIMIEHWLCNDVNVALSDGQKLSMWNPLWLQIVQYYYFVLTLGGRRLLDQPMDRVIIVII